MSSNNLMKGNKQQLISLITISSLLCAETVLASNPPAKTTISPDNTRYLSQLEPWSQTYDCGQASVTLSQSGNDSYRYEGVNERGQTLTINDGTQSTGRNESSIYRFSKDNTDYVLEDYGGGKAALSISSYPDSSVTYDCTTDGT